ncbi:hypothetical protein jhhlp_008269 [Lomentospora prolificans]|uniref:Uncharacterized protein n=1 Tax=Lomentospora prolificans TaxID=41688 RepID=A0A2N3MXK8_9PEZI|nr:hypothetical protein jhhlp_008269 [Lomentospora prolificans]
MAPTNENASVGSDSDVDMVMIDQDDLSNYNPGQVLPESPESIKKIRAWLEPTAYDIAGGEYRKHLSSHVAGTGSWLTSTPSYQEWLNGSQHGLLWIRGIPGSGKSVMAANLIDQIAKANPGCPVLFFFFRQIIDANHAPEALLRDWMHQVLRYSPPLQQKLAEYVENGRAIDSFSMEDLWRDLRMAFAHLPRKVFCVGDALDEMDRGHDAFLEALGALGQWRPDRVKVLITSRPVPVVELPLRKVPCLRLRLEENLVDADISTYVRFALSNSAIPQGQWKIIEDAVPGRANGLFLYAKLAMDAFLEPGADISAVLAHLPQDLNALYTDLLREHAQRSGIAPHIQHLILQSVTHATRPLRLLELAEMIKVCSPDGHTRDLKSTKDLIRAACGPLLEILADETVSVVHHSFTEYLKGTTRADDGSGYPILKKGPTHAQLAIACLRYLQSGCLDPADSEAPDDNGIAALGSKSYRRYAIPEGEVSIEEAQLRLRYPFFNYAASDWHHHINNSEAEGHDQTETNKELSKFFGNQDLIRSWVKYRWPQSNEEMKLVTPLHVSAKVGLISFTKKLADAMNIDPHDANGRTPIWWAASGGHSETIRVLVAAGANPDHDDNYNGRKPLHEAADKNHYKAIKALLDAGVDPLTPKTKENPGRRCGNAPRSVGHTALMYACNNGHVESVDVFLSFIKDIDVVHGALAWAAMEGNSKVVARILQYPGVDVNAKVRGDTPLFRACGAQDLDSVRILLQAGADPKITCESDQGEFSGGMGVVYLGQKYAPPEYTCLHQLCGLTRATRYWAGDDETADVAGKIFSLLLEAGIDVHRRTSSSGCTALHGAARRSAVLTRLLLDAGADANAVDSAGMTPLHHVERVEPMVCLVELGHANLNSRTNDGLTPLLCMLSRHHDETTVKFLEYGPDCKVLDSKGNTTLHVALKQWSTSGELVQALVKNGADPNRKNYEGLPPLLCIRSGNSQEGVLDKVLQAGADINATDKKGETVLFRFLAAQSGKIDERARKEFASLMDKGASPSIRDFRGRTLLHAAVETHSFGQSGIFGGQNKLTKVDFALSLGLDPHAVDYHGNSLLHELAMRRDNHGSYYRQECIAFWEHLIGLGLDVERQNNEGRTPLHILSTGQAESMNAWASLPIDLVISRTKNVDVGDVDGITPLHLAVVSGESYTKKLLEAGADPTVATYEGLTPLHLAARARQSNVVGLLLDALRKIERSPFAQPDQSGASDVPLSVPGSTRMRETVPGVDAVIPGRVDSITPLYYACRSGRPETVALLIEAGADATDANLFEACAGFEREDDLWWDNSGGGRAMAVKLNDDSRPAMSRPWNQTAKFEEMSSNSTTRLDEIIEMLVEHKADPSILQPQPHGGNRAISLALQDNRLYTAGLLQAVLKRHQDSTKKRKTHEPVCSKFLELANRYLTPASIQALREVDDMRLGRGVSPLFRHFMLRREYHLVEEMARLGAPFLPEFDKYEICRFSALVKRGFTSLVDKIGTIAAEAQLETGNWHAYEDKSRPGLWFANRSLEESGHLGRNPVPFIIEAVSSELPNMNIVRLLVEKFGVDINEGRLDRRHYDAETRICCVNSALHVVAVGNYWWQVNQALPYLLEAGADVNMRIVGDHTPLHVALGAPSTFLGPFSREAAKMLILAGADVNAVDAKGNSCLALANHDVELIKLLIAHGATVTGDSLAAAIQAKNLPVLRALLSGGADVNMCREWTPSEVEKLSYSRQTGLKERGLQLLHEMPLYQAGKLLGNKPLSNAKALEDFRTCSEIVRVLLDHGANPFAKFYREIPACEKGEGHHSPTTQVPEGYEECTILHELILRRHIVDDFLRLPGLDVNRRDAAGRTLLHAACQGYNGLDYIMGSFGRDAAAQDEGGISIFEHLLSLGADLGALDNSRRNVLHHLINSDAYGISRLFSSNPPVLSKNSLKVILARRPELINQGDITGQTPLHYAVTRAWKRREMDFVQDLLSTGADPHVVDNNGDTVLHFLLRDFFFEPVRALFRDFVVNAGLDINARNANGETPLFMFSARPKRERPAYSMFATKDDEQPLEKGAIAMLAELGADFFARDNRGRGLLHFAAGGDVDRFKELMELGLDPMLEDEKQQTAIDVAAACDNNDVLELFEKD